MPPNWRLDSPHDLCVRCQSLRCAGGCLCSQDAALLVPLAVRLNAAQGWHGGARRALALAPGTWWVPAAPRSPSPWTDDAWFRLVRLLTGRALD